MVGYLSSSRVYFLLLVEPIDHYPSDPGTSKCFGILHMVVIFCCFNTDKIYA